MEEIIKNTQKYLTIKKHRLQIKLSMYQNMLKIGYM